MAPEEETIVESADETPVEVVAGDVVEAPEEVTVEGDTTVIVETPTDESGGDAVEAVVIEATIDQAERIAALEAENASLTGRLAELELNSAIQEVEIEALAEADEIIVEATDDAIVDTIENAEIEEGGFGEEDEITTDEIEPVSSRVHWWFRSGRDLFNRR